MDEISKETRELSRRMIDLLNAVKGKEIKGFPVPPFSKWLNGSVVSAERGKVVMSFQIRPEMSNPTKILHGGMQSGILDDIIGFTCATLGYKGFLITIDFHIDFLGKAYVGETVLAEGRIVRDGTRIVHAEALLYNEKKELIASATSNLIKTTHKPEYVKNIEKNKK